MAATQRPVTEAALRDPAQAAQPGWTDRPSWHIFGSDDRNIPAAVMRAGADRADSRGTTEIPGASHALSVSQPEQVAQTILAATRALTPESERV
jgi:pimeloyl-ACP methyl ester carboxylesterase